MQPPAVASMYTGAPMCSCVDLDLELGCDVSLGCEIDCDNVEKVNWNALLVILYRFHIEMISSISSAQWNAWLTVTKFSFSSSVCLPELSGFSVTWLEWFLLGRTVGGSWEVLPFWVSEKWHRPFTIGHPHLFWADPTTESRGQLQSISQLPGRWAKKESTKWVWAE